MTGGTFIRVWTQTGTEGRPCKSTGRKQPSFPHGPQKKPVCQWVC